MELVHLPVEHCHIPKCVESTGIATREMSPFITEDRHPCIDPFSDTIPLNYTDEHFNDPSTDIIDILPDFDRIGENDHTEGETSSSIDFIPSEYGLFDLDNDEDNWTTSIMPDTETPSYQAKNGATTSIGPDYSEQAGTLLEDFEREVQAIQIEPITTTDMTSLLKQELSWKIQIGRLKRGHSELVLTPQPQNHYELREDEVLKRNKRRFQNRQSAYKSRLKSHARLQEIEQKFQSAVGFCKVLKKEIEQLKDEREKLRDEMDKHSRLCKTMQQEAERILKIR